MWRGLLIYIFLEVLQAQALAQVSCAHDTSHSIRKPSHHGASPMEHQTE